MIFAEKDILEEAMRVRKKGKWMYIYIRRWKRSCVTLLVCEGSGEGPRCVGKAIGLWKWGLR